MAQKIDTYLQDQFTDGAIRYTAAGIRDLAVSQWKFALAVSVDTALIGVWFDGSPTNADASKPVGLVTAGLSVVVFDDNGATLSTYPFSGWTNLSTGRYQQAITDTRPQGARIDARASFTNPAVSGKTSVVTDGAASYGAETITVDWVATAGTVIPGPIFDGVDFATGFSFR